MGAPGPRRHPQPGPALGNGAGTVVVYTMLDVSEAAHGGFPQSSDGGAAAEPGSTGDWRPAGCRDHIYPVARHGAGLFRLADRQSGQLHDLAARRLEHGQGGGGCGDCGVFMRLGGPGNTYDGERILQGTVDLSDIEAAIIAIAGTEGFVITSPTATSC